jgi:hypothetical protein
MTGKPVDHIEGEVWKPIPHRDYQQTTGLQFYASNFGRVKRQHITKKNQLREYLIKPTMCSNGKLKVCLYLSHNAADRASTYLSTLVLMAFYGLRNNPLFIVHLDHNYTNCKLDNLQYASQEEYYKHIGKNPLGPKLSTAKVIHPASGEIKTEVFKVPLATIRGILRDYQKGDFQQDIALRYNISQAFVSYVLSGKRRNKHTDILPCKRARQKRSGLLNNSPDVMEKPFDDHDKGKIT